MTKSSVDRKRSRYGEEYSLRFHKQLKIYHLSCNNETPHLIAKFVETDGDLAMDLFERLESNYKEIGQLKSKNRGLQSELQIFKEDATHSNLQINKLADENKRLKQRLASINHLIDNKIDEFKNGDYGDLPCNTIHMFLDLKEEIECSVNKKP